MNKIIVNCETGETSEIPLTAAEIKNRKITEAAILEANQLARAEAEARQAARLAILDRIGLTADELKTILG
jgi:hypothetical protein